MLLLALSLFFTEPIPLEMPQADAYLVRDGNTLRLEDRFQVSDLWTTHAVDGRWVDEQDRVFLLATFEELPPEDTSEDYLVSKTRVEYAHLVKPLPLEDLAKLREAVAVLSPVAIAEQPQEIERVPAGYRRLLYWQGTNQSAIVCTFREKKKCGREQPWRFACWMLAEGDDFKVKAEQFDEEFLRKRIKTDEELVCKLPSPKPTTEREMLRADARHAIALYDDWHATDGDEFEVLDHLSTGRDFIVTITNEFKTMRAKYAATVPTPIDGSNVLAVARIFGSRDEYLDALAADGLTNLNWSAAYWSQTRRELVAYLPEFDSEVLLATLRHEAFHQYLAYATSMITVSPWLNEGYAQFFEGDGYLNDTEGFWTEKQIAFAAEMLPTLLSMDYAAFYAGTDRERRFKYKFAEAIAVFIERGAPKVRFRPFAKLKENYFQALFDKKDMLSATGAAFGTTDNLKLFVAEWKKYMLEGRFKKND